MNEIAAGRTDAADAVDQAIGGVTQTIGSFRFWFADQRWEWSDEVAAMHGYAPGTIRPTTRTLLAHKHPDDRAHVAESITLAVQTGEPFSSRHRIIDTSGRIHEVIVVGDRLLDDFGTAVGTEGYYIDLTEILAQQRQTTLDETLPDLLESRAVIEQAKGVLMFAYDINAEQAFGVLRWRSQETNTKLRDLAAQLIADLPDLGAAPPHRRTQLDHLLLTVHQRIPPA
ncbi:PAS and ANTAR domain-containing protein [Nocardia sp. CA-129566]|uniref:PAS and ANTAR domain-containing protein n=1 Tax=Nocardia sp. CA-129566 TaxID=3239976 RepID=UPI003D9541DD